MTITKQVYVVILSALLLFAGAQAAMAQSTQVRSRVAAEVNDAQTVQTKGNIHPLARAEFDRGAVADSQPMTRMLLLLQRSPEQETALQQLLDAQQTRGSGNYHAWLTPQQFGAQFGPSDADLQKVTDWLTRQGFQISKVSNGRTTIEFSGNVAQVRNAFQTEIHKFSINGEEHFANVNNPAIPEALSPVVKGVVALHNFKKKAAIHTTGRFRQNMATGQITPLFTFTDVNGTFYAVGPTDFATIYHIPNYNQGGVAAGAGQSIGIVGRSNINIQDVRDFRSIFGLPPNDPQIILNGPDPGLVDGDEGESDLDVEWAGAVAPAAKVIFVTTQDTQTDAGDGIDASAIYIVDNNVAPILSESYGACESGLGANGNAFFNALWQQAAAEGITVVVAAGDNGSAGCDNPSTAQTAAAGLAVSGIASTPYNIAMGGTDFDYTAGVTTYWNNTNTAGTANSAKGYIPETPWNDSCAATGLTGCNTVTTASATLNIAAGSGGPSSIYNKPSWQVATGVPVDGHRDLPDVSLFSGDGVNGTSNAGTFYVVCQTSQNIPGDVGCNLTKFSPTAPFHDFQGVGGTSAATPTFAAIIALINAATGQRQGVANYALYRLANTAGVFHDITTGNNSVPCIGQATNCSKNTSGGFGVLATTPGGNILAYAAGTGYDMATGLGTVDVTNLLAHWASAAFAGTNVNLNAPSPASITVDATVSISGSVTKTSGTGTPSGFIILENASTHTPIGTFSLDASGNFSGTTTLLPGGTYSVLAHYGGDGIFGPKDSAPQPVTVGKQNSQVIVNWVSFNGTAPVLSTAAQSVAYGSPYILRIDVTNNSGAPCQNLLTGVIGYVCPTHRISLFQNTGAPLNDFPNAQTPNATNVAYLNDRGFAEDQPIQLNVGSYSITATYEGDNSYNAQSASNALSVTVTKAATTTAVTSNLTTITSGASVTLTAVISTQSNGNGPTGSVTFTNGTTTLGTGTCTPAAASASAAASCTAALTTAISALYPAPQNQPRSPLLPFVLFAMALAIFLGLVRWMPQHRRRAYAYAGLIAFALLATAIVGCGGGGGGGGTTGKTVTINAAYPGDTNYTNSTGSTSIHVN